MIVRLVPAVAMASVAIIGSAAAQPPSPAYVPTSLEVDPDVPRTPAGKPDLQGEVWAVNFFPVWEATPLSSSLIVSETEAKKLVDTMIAGMLSRPDENRRIDPEIEHIFMSTDGLPLVRGERRTRLLMLPSDGKLPIKPEIRKEAATFNPIAGTNESYETRPPGDRCLVSMGQPPLSMTLPFTRLRFVHTNEHVVIHTEMGDEVRIVPFADTHTPTPGKAWLGDGIARWEDNTLVIETVRLPMEARIRGFPKIVVGEEAKVVERFTRISKNELLYQWTVVDPDVYTGPWLAEFSFFVTNTGMYPSPCHEHNYSLTNILQGERVRESRAAADQRY